VFWRFGGGGLVFGQVGRGLGVGVVVGAVAPVFSPPPVALRCGVDLVGRRPVWSAASGLACGVVL
jgi:hypothetical protein